MTTLFHLTANNAQGVLDGALDSTSMTFDLDTGEGDNFPETDATSAPFWVTINNEIIEIEDRSDDTFTISERGAQNTLAGGHDSGDAVELYDTSEHMEELQDAVNDAEDDIDILQTEMTTAQSDIDNIEDGSTTLTTVTTTGDITCGDGVGDGSLYINGAAGSIRGVKLTTGLLARFAWVINDTAETGANAGSDCALISFDDAGAPVGFPLIITRATNAIAMAGDLSVAGDVGVSGFLNVGTITTFALASGVATVNQTFCRLQAETGTTDDLDTISGTSAGDIVFLRAVGGHTITIKHGTGNIYTDDGADVMINSAYYTQLISDGSALFILKQT